MLQRWWMGKVFLGQIRLWILHQNDYIRISLLVRRSVLAGDSSTMSVIVELHFSHTCPQENFWRCATAFKRTYGVSCCNFRRPLREAISAASHFSLCLPHFHFDHPWCLVHLWLDKPPVVEKGQWSQAYPVLISSSHEGQGQPPQLIYQVTQWAVDETLMVEVGGSCTLTTVLTVLPYQLYQSLWQESEW